MTASNYTQASNLTPGKPRKELATVCVKKGHGIAFKDIAMA